MLGNGKSCLASRGVYTLPAYTPFEFAQLCPRVLHNANYNLGAALSSPSSSSLCLLSAHTFSSPCRSLLLVTLSLLVVSFARERRSLHYSFTRLHLLAVYLCAHTRVRCLFAFHSVTSADIFQRQNVPRSFLQPKRASCKSARDSSLFSHASAAIPAAVSQSVS